MLTFVLFAAFTNAVEFISVSGGNFITNSTGKRFSIIGVE